MIICIIIRTQLGLASQDSASPITVMERSLYSERYCYVQVRHSSAIKQYTLGLSQMLAESGVIRLGEFALLDRWFHTLTSPTITGMGVDLIVYIRSDPHILMERINKRGRQVSIIIR